MTSPSVKLLRTQSDARLVALAAAGHDRAFEAIVERYRRTLLRHCRRYLPEARAEDALQQALVSAWSALRRGDEVRELSPWLHRIVHNTSLNALRAAGYDYEQLRDTLEVDGGPAELAERSAVVRQALAGLAALPERQREALLQIAVEGRSQDEVAAELGLSHGAVRQLVHRARTSLRTAATALTPLPLAGWLASAGAQERGDLVARVAELVAGAGGGATLAKAGAVAALAGGAVGGPVVADRIADPPGAPEPRSAAAAPARPDRERAAERSRAEEPAPPVVVAQVAQEPGAGAGVARGGGENGGGDGAGSGGDGGDRSRQTGPAQQEAGDGSARDRKQERDAPDGGGRGGRERDGDDDGRAGGEPDGDFDDRGGRESDDDAGEGETDDDGAGSAPAGDDAPSGSAGGDDADGPDADGGDEPAVPLREDDDDAEGDDVGPQPSVQAPPASPVVDATEAPEPAGFDDGDSDD